MTDKAADAVQIITSAIDTARSTGSTLWTPLNLLHLARAFAGLGKFQEVSGSDHFPAVGFQPRQRLVITHLALRQRYDRLQEKIERIARDGTRNQGNDAGLIETAEGRDEDGTDIRSSRSRKR